MKFGDIVVNLSAGARNPSKVMMVVHHGRNLTTLDLDGFNHTFRNEHVKNMKVVGSLNFSNWIHFAAQHRND